jgi:hypothetical protein
MGGLFEEIVGLFSAEDDGETPLSSRLAYDVAAAARYLPDPGEPFQAEVRRLIARHRSRGHERAPDPHDLATRLCDWAEWLPEGEQTETLARWLVLARFVAQGGGE